MTSTEPNAIASCGQEPEQDIPQRESERALLALLLAETHPWTAAELARELGGLAIDTYDALEGLVRAGLVNREGESVTASRAARVFEQLEA